MVPPFSVEAVHPICTEVCEVAVATTPPGTEGVATLLELPAADVWPVLSVAVTV